MAEKIKPYLTWLTLFLLILSVWTIRYQIQTVLFVLFLGIIGTMLIYATEVGYTYRKKKLITVGSMKYWLKGHIVMGVVGPLIIVLHTGLNFDGFAGWLTGLTAIVVASGFIGRYLYRKIPRSIKGTALSLKELQTKADEIVAHLGELKGLAEDHPDKPGLKSELLKIEKSQTTLERQKMVLDASKDMLSKWHLVHIPLTLALFVGIVIHIGSVFYYGQVLP